MTAYRAGLYPLREELAFRPSLNKLPDVVRCSIRLGLVSAATISTFKRRLDIWIDRHGH